MDRDWATPGHTKANSRPDGKDTGQPKWLAPSCQLPGSSGWKQLKVWSFPGDSSFPGSGNTLGSCVKALRSHGPILSPAPHPSPAERPWPHHPTLWASVPSPLKWVKQDSVRPRGNQVLCGRSLIAGGRPWRLAMVVLSMKTSRGAWHGFLVRRARV